MILPSFKEDYTGKEMIDLIGTLNEDFIKSHIPTSIESAGVHLEEDGSLKININAGA
jgi:hypothetical protein